MGRTERLGPMAHGVLVNFEIGNNVDITLGMASKPLIRL